VAGYTALRCRSCDHRFQRTLWDVRNSIYARCPNCYGLELTSWDVEDYHVRTSWRFRLAIGANAWRCEPCRRNFVSFFPRKYRWVRRKPSTSNSNAENHSVANQL
jgi:hypothetical protein